MGTWAAQVDLTHGGGGDAEFVGREGCVDLGGVTKMLKNDVIYSFLSTLIKIEKQKSEMDILS